MLSLVEAFVGFFSGINFQGLTLIVLASFASANDVVESTGELNSRLAGECYEISGPEGESTRINWEN